MPDNKLSSSSYTVSNISSTNTDTNIIRRPYANIPLSPGKRHNKSNSFRDTLNSIASKSSHNSNSEDFSDLLSNELNNMVRLESTENSRLVKSSFGNNASNEISNSNLNREFDEAVIENNAALLCKKISLLNSLKKESNN
ncbi:MULTISPECIES: hypothetical protein [unclassified Clostridium]|uniref:hypothetical protein n=1 Tax=unclassified Clostridium TaxID=2614128 RepID=UPI000297C662|nr:MULTISPECIES: hypothetical protein [unclassified Clostridium]EKQ53805.1 MAG: hypothetical protein A370_03551 [Clostridium sp. Maddingley MBC34-26]